MTEQETGTDRDAEIDGIVRQALGVPARRIATGHARVGVNASVETESGVVSLKYVPPEATDEHAQRRRAALRNEAEVLAAAFPGRLVAQRDDWLLTWWLPGESVGSVAARLRADADHAGLARLFRAMAGAVIELHRAGYWHGDLQPEHFLLGGDGAVSLLDFDVAVRRADPRPRYGGALVHYVSPEVAAGMLAGDQHIALDARTEVYSFGAVLHVLGTGLAPVRYTDADQPPTPGASSREDKLRAIVAGNLSPGVTEPADPADPAEQADGLRALIARCLSTDPAGRPADMTEVLTGVLAVLTGEGPP